MIECIAIDDEPIALDVIKNHISKIPFLELKKTFRNPIVAIEYLQNNKIDLLFLDINMPKLSGFEFLDVLPKSPKVIFTTAYSEHAVKGYDYDVVHYLVKPFNFHEFLKATTKAQQLLLKSTEIPQEEKSLNKDIKAFISIKSGLQTYKINVAEILYLEKDRSYVYFYFLSRKKILARMTIDELLAILPSDNFVRTHKSFIVAIDKIDYYESHKIVIKERSIPIGKLFKQQFLEKIV